MRHKWLLHIVVRDQLSRRNNASPEDWTSEPLITRKTGKPYSVDVCQTQQNKQNKINLPVLQYCHVRNMVAPLVELEPTIPNNRVRHLVKLSQSPPLSSFKQNIKTSLRNSMLWHYRYAWVCIYFLFRSHLSIWPVCFDALRNVNIWFIFTSSTNSFDFTQDGFIFSLNCSFVFSVRLIREQDIIWNQMISFITSL